MKSKKLLLDFINFCIQYPELRFWQALRNWSGFNFINASYEKCEQCEDTFYWETKNINKEE